ncbi:hypothetical protein [Sphingobium yanoikuyae]|uniref:hypothetical protein n=1 Tax=Sphingobium yanoikuyae TaxID=13690 RepID=UPI00241D99CE|nr:hypothetical protein [Sphingobium yanoikuyae]
MIDGKVKQIAAIIGATTARKVVTGLVVGGLALLGVHSVDPDLVSGVIAIGAAIVQVVAS